MVTLSPLRSDAPPCDTSASCFFHRGCFVGMPRAPCAVESMSFVVFPAGGFLIIIIFPFDSNVSVLKPKT